MRSIPELGYLLPSECYSLKFNLLTSAFLNLRWYKSFKWYIGNFWPLKDYFSVEILRFWFFFWTIFPPERFTSYLTVSLSCHSTEPYGSEKTVFKKKKKPSFLPNDLQLIYLAETCSPHPKYIKKGRRNHVSLLQSLLWLKKTITTLLSKWSCKHTSYITEWPKRNTFHNIFIRRYDLLIVIEDLFFSTTNLPGELGWERMMGSKHSVNFYGWG